MYNELERGKNLSYWNDITIIVEEELQKLHRLENPSAYEAAVGRCDGIHPSVAKEVVSAFRRKAAAQLEAMQMSGTSEGLCSRN